MPIHEINYFIWLSTLDFFDRHFKEICILLDFEILSTDFELSFSASTFFSAFFSLTRVHESRKKP